MPSFFLRIRRPRKSTLFPSTTLFRSSSRCSVSAAAARSRVIFSANRLRRTNSKDRKSTRLNSSHGYISYAVFFFKDPAPTEIYTLPLHDALPIFEPMLGFRRGGEVQGYLLGKPVAPDEFERSEEHTSELQSRLHLVCRLFF